MFGIRVKNILFILLGSAIFSFGIVHFNMPHNLGEGGLTGITLLLYFLFKWDPAITYLVFNIPLFFIGWKVLGRITFIYTLIGTFAVSGFLTLFQHYHLAIDLENDMTLVAILAGVFIGSGLGIIFRYGGTTGGADIIARIINKYIGWSMGKAMFLFDFSVIGTSIIFYLNMREGVYTLLLVYIGARVIDFIQEGAYSGRGLMIISKQYDSIAQRINLELERGVTVLNGTGYYTKEEQKVLYCIVGKNEIVKTKNLILETDPHAFVSVMTVHEVMGEGFTLDEGKRPLYPEQ